VAIFQAVVVELVPGYGRRRVELHEVWIGVPSPNLIVCSMVSIVSPGRPRRKYTTESMADAP